MGSGSHKFWDEEREQKLRKLWGTLTARQIAERLGCSKGIIDRMARKLDLPRLDPHAMNLKRP